MELVLQTLQPLDVVGLLRREGVEPHLVLTGRVQTPFHAEPTEDVDEPEPGRHDTYRADERGVGGIDLVGCTRDPVTTGGDDILAERQDAHALLRGELPDAFGDVFRLRRDPPGELMTMTTARRCSMSKARVRTGSTLVVDKPGRPGPPWPITPSRRTTATLSDRLCASFFAIRPSGPRLIPPSVGHRSRWVGTLDC